MQVSLMGVIVGAFIFAGSVLVAVRCQQPASAEGIDGVKQMTTTQYLNPVRGSTCRVSVFEHEGIEYTIYTDPSVEQVILLNKKETSK